MTGTRDEKVRETSKGTKYRVIIVPLNLLPRFYQTRGVEPKAWFFYPPENDYVLGVRPKESDEDQRD